MPVDLHFICKHGEHFTRVAPSDFETGNWSVAENTAQEAVGGRVYLHEKQRDAAWHGGTIQSWRPSDDPGRLVFRYLVDGPFRVVCSSGWSYEKAILRRAVAT